MADQTLSSLSKEYVKVPVIAEVNGAAYNPTADVVVMAFVPINETPQAGDWKTADWETRGAGTTNVSYYARCLVGPGGTVTLTPGQYVVWVKVTDSPEIPVLQAGTLEITP